MIWDEDNIGMKWVRYEDEKWMLGDCAALVRAHNHISTQEAWLSHWHWQFLSPQIYKKKVKGRILQKKFVLNRKV